MYCVIETTEKNIQMVVAVPKSWYVNGQLYWPDVKDHEVRKFIKNQITPEKNWKVYSLVKLLASDIGMKTLLVFIVVFI